MTDTARLPKPGSTPAPFDLDGPLPTGTTLLEASAGTGKTFTIAALATRYVAQGRARIDQLLMVTFGRSATRELRERVREALTGTRDALRDPVTAQVSTDPIVRTLAALPEPERDAALERLTRACADFDSATIATTHQFCLHALAGLGLHADTDPGETFVEDLSDVIDEVVDDLYVRKYGVAVGARQGAAQAGRLPIAEARALARAVVGDPQSDLDAGPVAPGSMAETRLRFARAVTAEVTDRRRARRLVTFDDLVLRLAAALTDPVTGEQAGRRLRERYRVVLVDEFQDTDPAQWTILRRAFHGQRTLILIGDPKQAIYAFRGADVFSYLDAAGHADAHATLATNHRSDAAVVNGIAALMGGLQLGDERIVVHPVQAAHAEPRLVGVPGDARFRLRTWHPADGELAAVGLPRAATAADVAADVVTTLSGPARLRSQGGAQRPVAPRDIAVLVTTHNQGELVRAALARVGVPVVIASAASVFGTPAALAWQTLLRAMDQPRATWIRAAALTDFLGHTAQELAIDGDRIDQEVGLRLREWARILATGSVAALLATISSEIDLAARVLRHPGGERHLTDLRHIAGVLHGEQRANRRGLPGLLEWLDDRVRRAGARDRESSTELTRRLETDAEAVQVLTVHMSKGLEFPIVYVPFGWDRFDTTPDLLRCHDDSGRRVLDVRGTQAEGRAALVTAHGTEESGETLRLLYVALTRASRMLVVHWASSKTSTRTAPLHRVLCARAAGEVVAQRSYPVADPPVAAVAASPWIAWEPVGDRESVVRWEPPVAGLPELAAAPFARAVDSTWRRTSYTGLTAGVHGAERAPAGFRDDEPTEDEAAASEPTGVVAGPGSVEVPGLPSGFADLPAGAAFGTLVHSVLEVVDTSAPDPGAEVAARCAEALAGHPMTGVAVGLVAPAIMAALRTPLGPLAAGRTLAGIAPGDRLAELDFELPMGAVGARTLADVAALLRAHLPADDPLAGYPDRLAVPGLGTTTLRGYLSGSIDAVLRVSAGADSEPGQRYLVVDYKTNLLRDTSAPGIERLAWGYRPEVLPAAMIGAHYPLQALLYSAALHRYLRWRLAGYDPHTHLGGVLYLFLRGMAGPDTPTQAGLACGVFSWAPPADLIVDLSDLLDGRQP
ncbi:MAG: UvrD-helicase domain-containing protein [Candidatus Nanopelagicales bacterium]